MACSLRSDKIYLKYIQDYIGIMINDAEGIWRPVKLAICQITLGAHSRINCIKIGGNITAHNNTLSFRPPVISNFSRS
jgi:hypothetical protein